MLPAHHMPERSRHRGRSFKKRERTSRCIRQGGAVFPIHRMPERVYHPGHAAVVCACHMVHGISEAMRVCKSN